MFKLNLSFLKKIDKNKALVGVAVLGILIVGALIYGTSSSGFSMPSLFGMSKDKIAKTAVDYINNNGLTSTPASLVSSSDESGLIKIKIKIGTSEFDSYVTKDGKLLFPQAIDISAKKNAANSDQKNQAAATITKSDKPMLEAYIVSRCPYGLQMQRAMAEAVKNMPSLAPYMKAIYMGAVSSDGKTITAMHGDAEAKENLRQICIREEQPTKYWNYVSCQMKGSGKEDSCATSTGVDVAKMDSCISDTSRGVAYAQKDFDLNTKYGVTGSPTLVLGGATISESSYGGRSADGVKSMICAGFNSPASFCSTKLDTTEAASSFSATYASTAAAASGDSGTNGANCAPAQ